MSRDESTGESLEAVGDLTALLASLDLAAAAKARMRDFLTMLAAANATMNLTAARTPQALLEHVVDSLELAEHVTGDLVDIGSGGGFPAIPLAIATGCRAVLVEAVQKKARFLHGVMTELALSGEVVAERAEAVARLPRFRAAFGTATARAVGPATTVLELTVPFLAIGGRALLQRGAFTADEREAVQDAAPMLGARLTHTVARGGRHLLVVTKDVPTPERFPRRAGVPAKRPLCMPAAP